MLRFASSVIVIVRRCSLKCFTSLPNFLWDAANICVTYVRTRRKYVMEPLQLAFDAAVKIAHGIGAYDKSDEKVALLVIELGLAFPDILCFMLIANANAKADCSQTRTIRRPFARAIEVQNPMLPPC